MKTPSFDQWMLGVAAACAVATAVEMLWPHPLRGVNGELASAATADAPRVAPLELAADYVAAIDRPLFTVDRKPYVVPPDAQAAKAAAPTAPELNAQLIAVVSVGGERTVLLRLGQAVRKLRGGETVDGWTVTRIDAAGVTVANGGFERKLDLNAVASR